jgi:phosphoglycolate phosphatase
LGVASYFDVIQGSGTGLPRKPDPAPLLKTIERLGTLPAATLYIGDSETDVLTARAAGVPVVLVSYGYTARPAAELGADRVYDSLADITGPAPIAISA